MIYDSETWITYSYVFLTCHFQKNVLSNCMWSSCVVSTIAEQHSFIQSMSPRQRPPTQRAGWATLARTDSAVKTSRKSPHFDRLPTSGNLQVVAERFFTCAGRSVDRSAMWLPAAAAVQSDHGSMDWQTLRHYALTHARRPGRICFAFCLATHCR